MKAILYIRNIQDWKSISIDQLRPVNDLCLSREIVELWNSTFLLDYFSFRIKLQEIAFENWEKTSIPSFVTLEEADWIIPTDDDDWFHPDLSKHLETVPKDVDVVHWDCVVHQTINSFTLSQWYDYHQVFCTNNYAVRGHLPNLNRILSCHEKTLPLLKSLKDIRIQKLEHTLSCYNHHFGGISTLCFCKRTKERLKTFNSLKRGKIPDKYKWIEPYSDRMFGLLGELQEIKVL